MDSVEQKEHPRTQLSGRNISGITTEHRIFMYFPLLPSITMFFSSYMGGFPWYFSLPNPPALHHFSALPASRQNDPIVDPMGRPAGYRAGWSSIRHGVVWIMWTMLIDC